MYFYELMTSNQLHTWLFQIDFFFKTWETIFGRWKFVDFIKSKGIDFTLSMIFFLENSYEGHSYSEIKTISSKKWEKQFMNNWNSMHPSVSYLVTFLPSKANLVFSKKIDSRLHGNLISRLLLYRRQAAVILAAHPSSFSYRNMKWMPIIFQFVFASRLQALEPMLHSSDGRVDLQSFTSFPTP